jgi:hypothetical protein
MLWNGIATLIQGRDGDDVLTTGDGDALDTAKGGAGTDTCIDNGDGDAQISC